MYATSRVFRTRGKLLMCSDWFVYFVTGVIALLCRAHGAGIRRFSGVLQPIQLLLRVTLLYSEQNCVKKNSEQNFVKKKRSDAGVLMLYIHL